MGEAAMSSWKIRALAPVFAAGVALVATGCSGSSSAQAPYANTSIRVGSAAPATATLAPAGDGTPLCSDFLKMPAADRDQLVSQIAVDRNEARVLQPGLRSNVEMVCGERLDQTVGQVIDGVAGKTTPTPTPSPTESASTTSSGADGSEYGPAGGWLKLSEVPLEPSGKEVSGKWCTKLIGDAAEVDAFTMGEGDGGEGAKWHAQRYWQGTMICWIEADHHEYGGVRIEVSFTSNHQLSSAQGKGSNGARVYADHYNAPYMSGNEHVDDWIALIAERVSK